jgi:signal transduction histidine kinase/CheY-like chemotaxis protein
VFPVEINLSRLDPSSADTLVASVRDITERKTVQEEILSKTAFLEAQINSSIDGILVVNGNGRNIFENKRSRELWGIPPGIEEANDPSVRLSYVMQKLKNPEQFKGQVQRLLAHPDENLQDEIELIDGTILERYSSSVLDKAGKFHGRIWIFHDVTERTRMENENLKLREKAEITSRLAAVGEMAAGIAHEINNPLTSIIGFAELLADKTDLPEDVKNDLKIISDGSHRVKEIVKRMLTFSRQTKPAKACININELIDATLDLRSYVLRTANINVVKRFDPTLHCVVADPGQMQQVFLNLIVNAEYSMKQAHGKGTLTITTEKTGNDVRISVKDDGAGMNKDIKEKVFNPFFTTKGVDEGTGLGLAITRSIVMEHGGTVEVVSEPGEGATFIIILPISETSVAEQPETVTAISKQSCNDRSARILVVDDEEPIRMFISAALSRSGHFVETTADAGEALAKMDSNSYDVVLTDIRMPGMSGIELYENIKPRRPELAGRFIFITGDVSDNNTRMFLENNRLSYITKPFGSKALVQKVSDVLASYQRP